RKVERKVEGLTNRDCPYPCGFLDLERNTETEAFEYLGRLARLHDTVTVDGPASFADHLRAVGEFDCNCGRRAADPDIVRALGHVVHEEPEASHDGRLARICGADNHCEFPRAA